MATVLPAIHVPAMIAGIAVTVRRKLLHAEEAGLPEVMISVKKEPAEAVPGKIHHAGIAVTVRRIHPAANVIFVMNGILQMKNLHAVLQEVMMSVVPIHAMKNLLVISR